MLLYGNYNSELFHVLNKIMTAVIFDTLKYIILYLICSRILETKD